MPKGLFLLTTLILNITAVQSSFSAEAGTPNEGKPPVANKTTVPAGATNKEYKFKFAEYDDDFGIKVTEVTVTRHVALDPTQETATQRGDAFAAEAIKKKAKPDLMEDYLKTYLTENPTLGDAAFVTAFQAAFREHVAAYQDAIKSRSKQ